MPLSPKPNSSSVQDKSMSVDSSDDSLQIRSDVLVAEYDEYDGKMNKIPREMSRLVMLTTPTGSLSYSGISQSFPKLFCTPPSSHESLSSGKNNEAALTHSSDELSDHSIEIMGSQDIGDVHGDKEIENNSIQRPVNMNSVKLNINSRKTIFCYFCESSVTNFPRHIMRNHKTELEVQKISALHPHSKERMSLLFALRKK